MDFSTLTGQDVTIGLILLVVVWKGFDLLKDFIMKKKTENGNGNGEREVKQLIQSVREVMQAVVVALAKHSTEINEMRIEMKATNTSALQATVALTEVNDTVKDKIKELTEGQRRIEDSIRGIK